MNENVVPPSAHSPLSRSIDTGLLALAIVGRAYQVDVDIGVLAHQLGLGGRKAESEDLVRGAKLAGLRARQVTSADSQRLSEVPRPTILRMQDGGYLVLTRMPDGDDGLHDPLDVRPRRTTLEQICETWSGEIVLVTRRSELDEVERRFGLGWFVESFLQHRKTVAQILISSLFVQLFALVSPLMFQVVVDKVLIHKSESTLDVIAVALALLAVFDVTLQYLRSYALYHTASRVDVELGAKVVGRLFKLPLSYFETRPTGQTVARIREIETIRTFLTGQAATSLVDVLFILIFIAFLFSYSVKMTVVVVCSIPVYLLVVWGIKPLLREKTKERFSRGAFSQQYLVESIVGASTVKAAAIEPLIQVQWEERLAAYVKASFQSVMLGNLGQVAIQFVSKITTVLILYLGAEAVMSGDLTVGQLVAFNMLSGQLVQPIIRLSQLWQDIQQVQISVERIGDIFNAPQEEHASSTAQIPRDPIQGAIKLQNVSFRYTEGTPDVLSEFSLEIPAGQVIGIVGPSGSGKSTLTKLIQRLYVPRQGKILIDGFDILHVHPAWFRRQIGAVLQETLLFNRSLHENIAIANPGMPRDRVANVAKLAGADDFIRDMPMGYATQIEERGANLSGGQRQRIAIARALARNPRILIFDEATSALDYESEKIIQENMRQIVRGRTVIIVAHRLAAVRNCDRIISMDKGRIVEDGTHDELLRVENGLYANLWALQRAEQ